ncbi:hypothetical protein LAZ40_04720 [Cereibacter sphaeroides]|uniref:hypothetical protein n=1 Tax=Cereibacter sphaeroides TaxID=1063 RepID=UPI001F2D9524|nr:hypothetical protein [Cereibacter sphaeroides]MCE6958359.1 hypothetical protein [Cereibacter sphaeroides]MCE6972226.1 hypothetical protein [Cereibacter sphaeroides]
MRYKDGFILFAEDLPRQVAWAPDEDPVLTVEGWFEAYSGFETHSAAREDAEDTARARLEAVQRGDMQDTYESLDDVGRDTPMRARVHEDGTVDIYDCAPDHGDEPAIGADEVPVFSLTPEQIYRDFGIASPVKPPAFGPGLHRCRVILGSIDEDTFRDHFGVSSAHVTARLMSSLVFLPMIPAMDTIGAELKSIEVGPHASVAHGEGLEVTLTVDVFAPRLFSNKVAEAGREAGRDGDWTPETAADAIFEGWFGANEVGSPVDMGFEIVTWSSPDQDPAEDAAPGF